MNKTTQETKKGVAVRKNIMVLFIIFLSFVVRGQSNDDYKMLEVLFHNKDNVLLSQNASNLSLKGIFEENINDSIFINAEKNRAWILKEKTSLSTEEIEKQLKDNIAVLEEIFTKENYEFIQNQLSNFVWSEVSLKEHKLSINIISEEKNKEQYTISKPIYTKDNKYVIVQYKHNRTTSIIILGREYDNWKIIQFVPLGFG